SPALCLGGRIVEGQLFEPARCRHDVPGLLLEQVEEFLFARKQAEHAVTTSSVQPGGGRLSARPRWRRLSPLEPTLANGHRDVNATRPGRPHRLTGCRPMATMAP